MGGPVIENIEGRGRRWLGVFVKWRRGMIGCVDERIFQEKWWYCCIFCLTSPNPRPRSTIQIFVPGILQSNPSHKAHIRITIITSHITQEVPHHTQTNSQTHPIGASLLNGQLSAGYTTYGSSIPFCKWSLTWQISCQFPIALAVIGNACITPLFKL